MSTISENIIAVTNQKLADQQKVEDAKAAIRLKGVDVPVDTKLGDLDAKIALIDEWVAPADWIQLEEPADNEILLLASDINPYYAFLVAVVGGYTVDWGDGTVDNWASGTTASHTYAVGTGQACSRGYTTFKIRIYAQTPANNITVFRMPNVSLQNYTNTLLVVKYGTQGLTTLNQSFWNEITINGKFFARSSGYIEYVQLPYSLTSCTDYGRAFRDLYSLKKIRMPYVYSSGFLNFGECFLGCGQLRSIDYNVSELNISLMNYAHGNNIRLKSAKLPAIVNGCTRFSNTFGGCSSLEKIVLPIINTDTQFNTAIQNCISLKEIIFNESWNNRIITFQGNNGVKLERTDILPTMKCTGNGFATAFQGWMFRNFYFPTNANNSSLTDINGMFQSNIVKTIIGFPALPNVTNYASLFRYCWYLTDVDNLDQLGDTTSNMDLASAYQECYSLNPAGGLRVRNKITGRFILAGVDANNKAALQALLFTNPAAVSTWAGASPQIDISYCSMEAAALNALFTSIIATSASFSGKTIRITGNPGDATCDTTIITNAGGTVNKTT